MLSNKELQVSRRTVEQHSKPTEQTLIRLSRQQQT
jgi:hypothetical protein